VKKLISIGVALALLTMAVMPAVTAAQCDYDGIEPTTYAKIPFAIIGSGFYLLEDILGALQTGGLLPDTFGWAVDLMQPIGDWTMGPLGWSVDMLAWGVGLVGTIVTEADGVLTALGIDLGMDLAPVGCLFQTIACSLFTPFVCEPTGAAWNPCDPCP
jgi:hypothetical protein